MLALFGVRRFIAALRPLAAFKGPGTTYPWSAAESGKELPHSKVACLLLFVLASTASAQLRFARPSNEFELSKTVQVDRADGAALARLERVKACLAEKQWDEAVETLRQVMETGEGRLLEVAPGHFVNLSDACQMQLAALPPERPEALSPPRRSGGAEMV